jgi:hypothetical protein
VAEEIGLRLVVTDKYVTDGQIANLKLLSLNLYGTRTTKLTEIARTIDQFEQINSNNKKIE